MVSSIHQPQACNDHIRPRPPHNLRISLHLSIHYFPNPIPLSKHLYSSTPSITPAFQNYPSPLRHNLPFSNQKITRMLSCQLSLTPSSAFFSNVQYALFDINDSFDSTAKCKSPRGESITELSLSRSPSPLPLSPLHLQTMKPVYQRSLSTLNVCFATLTDKEHS